MVLRDIPHLRSNTPLRIMPPNNRTNKCLDTADIQAEVIRHNNTITTISNSHLTNMVRFRNNNTGVRCIKDSKT